MAIKRPSSFKRPNPKKNIPPTAKRLIKGIGNAISNGILILLKNVKYFFDNAKKAKKNAQIELTTAKRTSVILKTVAHDIATTAELGRGKRRIV